MEKMGGGIGKGTPVQKGTPVEAEMPAWQWNDVFEKGVVEEGGDVYLKVPHHGKTEGKPFVVGGSLVMTVSSTENLDAQSTQDAEVMLASGKVTAELGSATAIGTATVVGTASIIKADGVASTSKIDTVNLQTAQEIKMPGEVLYVTQLLAKRKFKETMLLNAMLTLLLGLWCYLYADNQFFLFTRNAILFVLVVNSANYLALFIRVKLRFYGNNASEVREILRFISDNSKDDTFGGGGRKIRIARPLDEVTDSLPAGMPASIGGSR